MARRRVGRGSLHFYMKIGGSLRDVRVNNALTAGEWQLVAGTYDGSAMRLYRNGIELGSRAVAGEVSGSDGLRLGSSVASRPSMGCWTRSPCTPTRSRRRRSPGSTAGRSSACLSIGSGAARFADLSGFGNDGACTGTPLPGRACGRGHRQRGALRRRRHRRHPGLAGPGPERRGASPCPPGFTRRGMPRSRPAPSWPSTMQTPTFLPARAQV